jgi:hypothetical protein
LKASAGFFKTPFDQFPRIQIVTVEQLLEGKIPNDNSHYLTGNGSQSASQSIEGGALRGWFMVV